jgi:hypothetical protein
MNSLRPYEPPKITTLTSEQILDLMGPAQASASGDIAPYPSGSPDSAARGGSRSRFGD